MAEFEDVRIVVSGKNIDVTPALRAHAERRVEKLIKHFDTDRRSFEASVVLAVQRGEHKAEVTLKVGRMMVRAEARTHEMYQSIDEAVDRIERQIRKYKTQLRRRAVDGPGLGQAVAVQAGAEESQDGEVQQLPRVVRTKRFALKPMSVEEAALQMEMLGHDFFVFANADTEAINVLYRRHDGDLGLIEPELA